MVNLAVGIPSKVFPSLLRARRVSAPDLTLPKTTYFPLNSESGLASMLMKN